MLRPLASLLPRLIHLLHHLVIIAAAYHINAVVPRQQDGRDGGLGRVPGVLRGGKIGVLLGDCLFLGLNYLLFSAFWYHFLDLIKLAIQLFTSHIHFILFQITP